MYIGQQRLFQEDIHTKALIPGENFVLGGVTFLYGHTIAFIMLYRKY